MKNIIFLSLCFVLFGCAGKMESKLLLISTNQSVGNLIEDEIGKLANSLKFKLERSENTALICEDTLKHFTDVIFNRVELNKFDHFQINALERFVEAGGNMVIFEILDSVFNKYKWPVFYNNLNEVVLHKELQNNSEIHSYPFGLGRLIVTKLNLKAPENQRALVEKTINMSIENSQSLSYTTLSTQLVPPDYWFETDTLVISSFNEPIEMEVLKNGDVILIERAGKIKFFDATQRAIRTIAHLPTISTQSNGLNGLSLDPDFENNGYIYFSYTPSTDPGYHRISRFQLIRDSLVINSEHVILKHPIILKNGFHGINAMEFDSNGNLYFSIGDFTVQTNGVAGYGQIDERKGKNDSQATSANSNNLFGKISRIHPEKDGTYTIPKGNLFPDNDNLTKPEIYIMGCRNPYRFTLDSHTNTLYFGDVGPDAWGDGKKGPRGYDELNIANSPGNYGWPYLVADNKPYRNFDYKTGSLGSYFDPDNLLNDSPNNTGRKKLLRGREAVLWYPKSESQEFPDFGSGGMNIMIGPKYYIEDYDKSEVRFPSYFNQRLFMYDWVRGWIKTIKFDENLNIVQIEPFLSSQKFKSMIDMKFGIDGTLYLLEYGTGGYSANSDASLKRITFVEGKPPSSVNPITNNAESHKIERAKNPIVWGLLESNNCLICHQIDKKLIGPSFKEISKRYAKLDSAKTYLPEKIMAGGTGNWPSNIAMPANPLLSETQAEELVKFIMDQ